jgi:hypothetical protein
LALSLHGKAAVLYEESNGMTGKKRGRDDEIGKRKLFEAIK